MFATQMCRSKSGRQLTATGERSAIAATRQLDTRCNRRSDRYLVPFPSDREEERSPGGAADREGNHRR